MTTIGPEHVTFEATIHIPGDQEGDCTHLVYRLRGTGDDLFQDGQTNKQVGKLLRTTILELIAQADKDYAEHHAEHEGFERGLKALREAVSLFRGIRHGEDKPAHMAAP